MITAQTSPLYLEEQIAEQLGLSRKDLRYVRGQALQKRNDWSMLGRHCVYSEAGLKRVLDYLSKARLGIEFPPAPAFDRCLRVSSEKKKAAAPVLVQLIVIRALPNRRLLDVSDPEEKKVRCQVADNRNFRPRMPLKARLLGPGLYQLEGRCPRFPGRY